jgi:hypothetical protein
MKRHQDWIRATEREEQECEQGIEHPENRLTRIEGTGSRTRAFGQARRPSLTIPRGTLRPRTLEGAAGMTPSDLALKAQIVPETVLSAFFVAPGVPSRKTKRAASTESSGGMASASKRLMGGPSTWKCSSASAWARTGVPMGRGYGGNKCDSLSVSRPSQRCASRWSARDPAVGGAGSGSEAGSRSLPVVPRRRPARDRGVDRLHRRSGRGAGQALHAHWKQSGMPIAVMLHPTEWLMIRS